MNESECTRRMLAASDYMVVEQCSCGSVHVTIGAVTLRLTSTAIPALATTLGDAARALVLCDAFTPAASRNELLS